MQNLSPSPSPAASNALDTATIKKLNKEIEFLRSEVETYKD